MSPIFMEYKHMRMPELKSLVRDRGLRNYYRMRKAELVALLQNNSLPGQSRASAAPCPHTRPPPPLQMSTWEPIDDRRLNAPAKQEMDMFEQTGDEQVSTTSQEQT